MKQESMLGILVLDLVQIHPRSKRWAPAVSTYTRDFWIPEAWSALLSSATRSNFFMLCATPSIPSICLSIRTVFALYETIESITPDNFNDVAHDAGAGKAIKKISRHRWFLMRLSPSRANETCTTLNETYGRIIFNTLNFKVWAYGIYAQVWRTHYLGGVPRYCRSPLHFVRRLWCAVYVRECISWDSPWLLAMFLKSVKKKLLFAITLVSWLARLAVPWRRLHSAPPPPSSRHQIVIFRLFSREVRLSGNELGSHAAFMFERGPDSC